MHEKMRALAPGWEAPDRAGRGLAGCTGRREEGPLAGRECPCLRPGEEAAAWAALWVLGAAAVIVLALACIL